MNRVVFIFLVLSVFNNAVRADNYYEQQEIKLTCDTPYVWDEEAVAKTFYHAEKNAFGKHNEQAWQKFLNSWTDKEQTINNFFKLIEPIFPNATQHQKDKFKGSFAVVLSVAQGHIDGKKLELPDCAYELDDKAEIGEYDCGNGKIWIKNVKNTNNTTGACVPQNTCQLSEYKREFCNTAFADIQVPSTEYAVDLIYKYMWQTYQQPENGVSVVFKDVDNMIGQDYIGVYYDGDYMVFEFDDANENISGTGADGYAKGKCIAVGGKYEGKSDNVTYPYTCSKIDSYSCEKINGTQTYQSNTKCRYKATLN